MFAYVPKNNLTVSFMQSLLTQRPVANSYSLAVPAGLKKHKTALDQCFFAMEHTGWYTLELCCFLQDQQLAFALYSPLHLKRSLGLARGKNDRVDAQRIAHCIFRVTVPVISLQRVPLFHDKNKG